MKVYRQKFEYALYQAIRTQAVISPVRVTDLQVSQPVNMENCYILIFQPQNIRLSGLPLLIAYITNGHVHLYVRRKCTSELSV